MPVIYTDRANRLYQEPVAEKRPQPLGIEIANLKAEIAALSLNLEVAVQELSTGYKTYWDIQHQLWTEAVEELEQQLQGLEQ